MFNGEYAESRRQARLLASGNVAAIPAQVAQNTRPGHGVSARPKQTVARSRPPNRGSMGSSQRCGASVRSAWRGSARGSSGRLPKYGSVNSSTSALARALARAESNPPQSDEDRQMDVGGCYIAVAAEDIVEEDLSGPRDAEGSSSVTVEETRPPTPTEEGADRRGAAAACGCSIGTAGPRNSRRREEALSTGSRVGDAFQADGVLLEQLGPDCRRVVAQSADDREGEHTFMPEQMPDAALDVYLSAAAEILKSGAQMCASVPRQRAGGGTGSHGSGSKRARESSAGNVSAAVQEVALAILHQHGYDHAAALAALDAGEGTARNSWSAAEASAFDSAFCSHGKDFAKIHKALPQKRMSQLVQYYYERKPCALLRSGPPAFLSARPVVTHSQRRGEVAQVNKVDHTAPASANSEYLTDVEGKVETAGHGIETLPAAVDSVQSAAVISVASDVEWVSGNSEHAAATSHDVNARKDPADESVEGRQPPREETFEFSRHGAAATAEIRELRESQSTLRESSDVVRPPSTNLCAAAPQATLGKETDAVQEQPTARADSRSSPLAIHENTLDTPSERETPSGDVVAASALANSPPLSTAGESSIAAQPTLSGLHATSLETSSHSTPAPPALCDGTASASPAWFVEARAPEASRSA